MECHYSVNYQEKEEDLLCAITEGNLEKVRQLLTSGMGINTVLHSKTSQQSATVLSTAAYEGHIHIMRYLITCNALVNYQDPLLSRTSLHWACMGGHVEAVRLLLQYSSTDVNCQDRDNVTPIIHSAICGSNQVVQLLIEHGANVSSCDRLHSSPLHYSTFHGRSAVTSTLIKSGCIANDPTIFGQGTPLANLVYHGDVSNCCLLLASGYSMGRDQWVLDYNHDTEIGNMLRNHYLNPASLSRLCRKTIRRLIGSVHLEKKIYTLPLPRKIIEFLTLDIL
ncbi:hypothetical protein LSH36_107g00005 [Paralvinella palmiformis]|uniref:SOCS box domain-containing protein n=1 Tax=Paralvinella palmiformis TaxID=53620 RepID=A0AAD9JZ44_9ANNE|nr:hypothetical protein LSH36_107g00005 [Paralvinella palmiformis]